MSVTDGPTGYVKLHSEVQVRSPVAVTMPPLPGKICTLSVQVATANVAVSDCAPSVMVIWQRGPSGAGQIAAFGQRHTLIAIDDPRIDDLGTVRCAERRRLLRVGQPSGSTR